MTKVTKVYNKNDSNKTVYRYHYHYNYFHYHYHYHYHQTKECDECDGEGTLIFDKHGKRVKPQYTNTNSDNDSDNDKKKTKQDNKSAKLEVSN